MGVLKFNVDEAARGKITGIGRALHNHYSLTSLSSSCFNGVNDSDEAEIFAILELLKLFRVSFHEPWIECCLYWEVQNPTSPK